MGRQILNIPMCVNCAVACENDDKDTLMRKALGRIDVADGGLSRQRWTALKKTNILTPLAEQCQLGGDSSMDMPELSDIPLTITTQNEGQGQGELKARDEGESENENETTIAKLHYRRSKDPRFAELECVVPLESSVYVSILDPLNAPAFRPCPAKPLPEWMRLLPAKNCREETRPRSILDIHFPPAAAFVRPETSPPLSRVGELPAHEERTETGAEVEMGMVCPRFPSTSRPPVASPPIPLSPPQRRGLQRRTSSESLHSQFLDSVESMGSPSRSRSPANFRFPSSASPPPYKRPSAVADEPLRRPSSQLTSLKGVGEYEYAGAGGSPDAVGANADMKTQVNTNAKPTLEAKGKTVAWDKTVAGGESESKGDSESSCESYERKPMERGDIGLQRDERPQTPPQRRPSPLAAVWHRVVKTRTPPAQSKEFLDLYAADKSGDTRLASLAVPGRRRGKEVGWGKGRVCSKCGNVSND
ncbi:hypothetical protein F5Y10DRAFT_292674 [Nemania abortiva]|nr:hypothetical protein F5Y10DRAFT_292674 [Nemania abortiva]